MIPRSQPVTIKIERGSRLGRCLLLLPFLWFGRAADATAALAPDTGLTRSVSGQFIIHDQRRTGASALAAQLVTNAHYVALDPTVLGVSCERVKQDVCRALGITESGNDTVQMMLQSASSSDDIVRITRARFPNGWQYRVDLPDAILRTRLVRAIVQVALLDFANRNAPARSADIPLWLIEGLTQQLLASDGVEIIVPPPQQGLDGRVLSSTNMNARREDPLNNARVQFREHAVLTFADLSWPEEKTWDDQSSEIYGLSAQLFVHELLTVENGRGRLRDMLTLLPDRYNWQVAFVAAFSPEFPRLLEVEKWWALRTLQFTSPDPIRTLPIEESWRRLEQALRQAAEVRGSTNELPVQTETNLEAVVSSWDHNSQVDALQSRVREIDLLRPRLAPALGPVADGYRQALTAYLEQIGKKSSHISSRKEAAHRKAQASLASRLKQLDSRLEALKPKDEPVADTRAIPVQPGP
jgi:hypothetical protein